MVVNPRILHEFQLICVKGSSVLSHNILQVSLDWVG